MEMQTEDSDNCNLSFKMTKDLKTHMLQHYGKKSHSCNQCGFSSISASNLKTHMLVHSGTSFHNAEACVSLGLWSS
jgi:KRAB domain-containing zinc finger protein